jgi:hypothetical protein
MHEVIDELVLPNIFFPKQLSFTSVLNGPLVPTDSKAALEISLVAWKKG